MEDKGGNTIRKTMPYNKPHDFNYMRGLLFDLALKLNVERLYVKLWNPINYAAVGGIGVIINYSVWFISMRSLPWFLCNALAIVCAWSWNWLNSVGWLGYLWGFAKNDSKTKLNSA